MVAWWLRGMTLLNLAVLVVWLAWAWPQSVPWALGGALLWALAGRWWLGQQFVCLALVRRSRGEPPLPLATLLRAWNAECRVSLRALGWDPMGLDALQARTGMDTATLQARLLEHELAGDVARLPGGRFQRLGRA